MAHQEGDCEDCGRLHIPWSVHQRQTELRLEHLGEVLLIMDEIEKVIEGRNGYAVSIALGELDRKYF